MYHGGSFLKLADDNISTLRIQKLKIGRLGGFEKIEFEKNAL